jgi:hypothetical protein
MRGTPGCGWGTILADAAVCAAGESETTFFGLLSFLEGTAGTANSDTAGPTELCSSNSRKVVASKSRAPEVLLFPFAACCPVGLDASVADERSAIKEAAITHAELHS